MQELIVRESVEIQAPAKAVWRVLVAPELTRQYMFGCEALSDWKPGSPLLWAGTADGKQIVYVKGVIVACDPPRLLQYTTFDPNGTLADVPANYVAVTCRLTPVAAGTRLEASQGDFAGVVDAQRRYDDTQAGWSSVLPKIKALAEGLARGG